MKGLSMTPKRQEFVKYGIIIVIIAVILGSCKKGSDPVDKPTTPGKETSTTTPGVKTPTPLPVATPKIPKIAPKEISGVVKIARSAKSWNSALAREYGKDAPNMTLKDINGKSLSISGLKGQKTVIVMWSTTNEPSKQMVQTLAELQSKVGADKLAVIAISNFEDPAILKPVVKAMDIHFPVVGRGNRLIAPYRNIRETPVCFFIDKSGKTQLITRKVIPPDDLNSLVEAL
jgi:peroxiredoxin